MAAEKVESFITYTHNFVWEKLKWFKLNTFLHKHFVEWTPLICLHYALICSQSNGLPREKTLKVITYGRIECNHMSVTSEVTALRFCNPFVDYKRFENALLYTIKRMFWAWTCTTKLTTKRRREDRELLKENTLLWRGLKNNTPVRWVKISFENFEVW